MMTASALFPLRAVALVTMRLLHADESAPRPLLPPSTVTTALYDH